MDSVQVTPMTAREKTSSHPVLEDVIEPAGYVGFQKANKLKTKSILTTNFLSGLINLKGLLPNYVQVNLPGRLSRHLYRQTDANMNKKKTNKPTCHFVTQNTQ